MSGIPNPRQIRVERRSPSYWRVTFDHPPLNIFGPQTIAQLNEIITALETDENVKVVVFDSAVEGFFLTHYDFLTKLEDTTSLPPGPTGLQALPDMLVRLSRAPVVSIVSIRGRATGVGSELSLASDMRFASREKAILSQWEVGAGLVPGGGPMARLPRLIGRGRALEVLLGADDIPGDLAELYGYVNRALPDAQLDAFVDALAVRIASFDKQAIAETKNLVNVASLPPDAEIAREWDVGGERDAYLAGEPAEDARFVAVFAHSLEHSGGYTPEEAKRVAGTLLPDMLSYDPTRPASFPGNGRTLTDDAGDAFLAVFTNGRVTGDKVGAHSDLLAEFPYLGPPHTATT